MFGITKNGNAEKICLKIKNLAQERKIGTRRALYEIGKNLAKDARGLINQKPKHGKVYRKYAGIKGKKLARPTNYTASAPGEAPAVVTGLLRKSINFTVKGSDEMFFGVDLDRGNADYGKYLEYKNLIAMRGKGSKNIEPRPFISAAYQKNKRNIQQKFGIEINKELKK